MKMRRRGYQAFAALGLASALPPFLCDCTGDAPSVAPDAGASGIASAVPSATASPAESGDDDVRPVYPETKDPPHPLAQRYCALVHELPQKNRRECCPALSFSTFRPLAECTRTLSFALRSGAVTIEQSAFDACERAVVEEAKRCDWDGSLPRACKGLFVGTVEEGKLCRSSLECKANMHCQGLSATQPGRCMAPLPAGTPCGGSADTLGGFTGQDAYAPHPECAGHCERRVCKDSVGVGQTCTSQLQCGPARWCSAGRCTAAPLPGEGEPCPEKLCAEGLACIGDTCVAPKALGSECNFDQECRSGYCEVGERGTPTCLPKCHVIRPGPARAPLATAAPKK